MKCISAQPSTGFHGLEGLKHMPTAIVPGIYDDTLADDNLWIETEDAYAMVRRLAREEGLLVGISSGATCYAARAAGARAGGARRDRRDRHHPLRRRRQISERTFLGRGMIRIEAEPWAAMVAHARADVSQRMLRRHAGRDRRRRRSTCAWPCRSRTPSRARRRARYELRPEDLLAADKAARERGMDLIGIYHSHPDCDAYFSKTDLKNSCPWYSFVVLSIQKGEFDHANSWLPNCGPDRRGKRRIDY